MNDNSNGAGNMTLAMPGDITSLLHAWQADNGEAQHGLWSALYGELRGLARGILHSAGRGARHDATSLVHKAYLRLLLNDVDWRDRHHFFAVAARAMRFVLTDEARRQLTKKRGAGEILPLADDAPRAAAPPVRAPEEVLSIHQALTRLAEINPRYEKLVELRYFAGLSVAETAEILVVTPRTVVRDWKTVRIWLLSELRAAGEQNASTSSQ